MDNLLSLPFFSNFEAARYFFEINVPTARVKGFSYKEHAQRVFAVATLAESSPKAAPKIWYVGIDLAQKGK